MDANADAPADDVLAWIGEVAGGRVVSARRQGRWRPQWHLRLRTPAGDERALFLRSARDPEQVAESALLSHFSIEREGRALSAVARTPVPAPRCFGFHEPSQSLLLEEISGADDFSTVADPAARHAIVRDYARHLATLHGTDPASCAGDLDPIPKTPETIAIANKFHYAEADYLANAGSRPADPLLEYGRWWLHHHVPGGVRPVCLLQGDTGPGQFLFEGQRVTALIDWEMAHLGDPMLDLGVMRMRELLYPTGLVPEILRHYAACSPHPVDRPALQYYTVMSMLLSPLAMATSLAVLPASQPTIVQRLAWDVILRRGLCEALLEASGASPVEPTQPDASSPSPPLNELLVRLLGHLASASGASGGEHERYALRTAKGLAEVVALRDDLRAHGEDAALRELSTLVGAPASTREEAVAAAAAVVADRPERVDSEWLQVLYRIERRREHWLEPILGEQAHERLAPLAAAGALSGESS